MVRSISIGPTMITKTALVHPIATSRDAGTHQRVATILIVSDRGESCQSGGRNRSAGIGNRRPTLNPIRLSKMVVSPDESLRLMKRAVAETPPNPAVPADATARR